MSIEIVSESHREFSPLPRPEASVHPWCPKDIGEKPPIYISASAADSMFEHCLSEKESKKEVMGLMIGELYRDEDDELFGLVRQTATSKLESDNVSVRFADFSQLMSELDEVDYDWILLGWYHSHPGHTCFLSSTDINTHNTMFKQKHQFAVVIDPINIEAKNFNTGDNGVEEIPLAIVGDISDIDGVPLHIRSPTRTAASHGGFEPVARAVEPVRPSRRLKRPEIVAMALGIITGLTPILYQMITDELQPHWFNTPTVLMLLIGYLTFLVGFQRSMTPIYNSLSHPSMLGPILMLFGISSAGFMLLLGVWRALTGAWEDHFAHYTVFMGMIAVIGAMMRPSSPPSR